MKNLILTLFTLISLSLVSNGQTVSTFDLSMGREVFLELPDTIYCVYGTIEKSENFTFVSYNDGVIDEKSHYFLLNPFAIEVPILDGYDIVFKKKILLEDNYYIIEKNLDVDKINVVYLSDDGSIISKQEHEDRVTLFDSNMKALVEHFK